MNARQPEREQTSPLGLRLRERIERDGPMTFRDWMEAALYDPAGGYYHRRDLMRWGRAGDYMTSPHRSPLFAATFASYFVRLYEALESPNDLTIIEAGAGAGDFAFGVLQTLRRDHPKIFARTRYLIDEASPDADERARLKLAPFQQHVEFHHPDERSAPTRTAIVFANELLDALPVHRVTMRGGQLLEHYVGCDDAGAFVWAARQVSTPRLAAYFERLQLSLTEGQLAEVNLAALDWLTRASARFRRGFLINVDYGAEACDLYTVTQRPLGTLRAFRRHQLTDDVLAHPGEQDLTTTVDWTSLRNTGTAAGLQTVLFERQDKFLLQAGFLDQLERLSAQAQSEAERVSLRSTARDMILPNSMSASFQILIQKR
jgi:SAM-dependent MidA family methyltransferase